MSRFENGWVKLHRRAVTEDIGWNGVQLAVWVTLLCWANRFETKIQWKGQQRTLPPGSVVTAIRDLGAHLKFSKDAIGRALRQLEKRGSISIEGATRGTLVTICKWAEYQQVVDEAATQPQCARGETRTLDGRQPDLIGEVKNKRSKSRFDYPQDFEEIYSSYPRREGKQAGFKFYQAEIRTAESREQLKIAIRHYGRAKLGTDPRYLLMFSTFMGQWGDWLDPKAGTSSGAGAVNTKPLQLEDIA